MKKNIVFATALVALISGSLIQAAEANLSEQVEPTDLAHSSVDPLVVRSVSHNRVAKPSTPTEGKSSEQVEPTDLAHSSVDPLVVRSVSHNRVAKPSTPTEGKSNETIIRVSRAPSGNNNIPNINSARTKKSKSPTLSIFERAKSTGEYTLKTVAFTSYIEPVVGYLGKKAGLGMNSKIKWGASALTGVVAKHTMPNVLKMEYIQKIPGAEWASNHTSYVSAAALAINGAARWYLNRDNNTDDDNE